LGVAEASGSVDFFVDFLLVFELGLSPAVVSVFSLADSVFVALSDFLEAASVCVLVW
jgi:hypothetical protein